MIGTYKPVGVGFSRVAAVEGIVALFVSLVRQVSGCVFGV